MSMGGNNDEGFPCSGPQAYIQRDGQISTKQQYQMSVSANVIQRLLTVKMVMISTDPDAWRDRYLNGWQTLFQGHAKAGIM
jgi:hypothetical protein